MRAKIITDIRKYLIDEDIYTSKDEITLVLLENTYSLYQQSVKDVKQNGQTIQVKDYKGNVKTVANPSFRNQMELQKELFKLIDSLYLTPKSRKTKTNISEDKSKSNPFLDMMRDIEKR